MKKPNIPEVRGELTGLARVQFDKAVKERLEIITGLRGGSVAPLDESASLDDVIAKINELLDVLQ